MRAAEPDELDALRAMAGNGGVREDAVPSSRETWRTKAMMADGDE